MSAVLIKHISYFMSSRLCIEDATVKMRFKMRMPLKKFPVPTVRTAEMFTLHNSAPPLQMVTVLGVGLSSDVISAIISHRTEQMAGYVIPKIVIKAYARSL